MLWREQRRGLEGVADSLGIIHEELHRAARDIPGLAVKEGLDDEYFRGADKEGAKTGTLVVGHAARIKE